MTLTEYTNLKEDIELSVGNSEHHGHLLNTLKELFVDDINSHRRFELINSISDLLHILEIRDVLSEERVIPLKMIAKHLPNKHELLFKIKEYEGSRSSIPSVNVSNRPISTVTHITEDLSETNYLPGISSSEKRRRIYVKLTEELGVYWRDLGRNLKIREGLIDTIDKNCNSTSEKARKLIETYIAEADPERWFFFLCQALDGARRRDLRRSIEEILVMNV